MSNLGFDVRQIVLEILQEKHVAEPAEIVSFDADNLRAKIKLKHTDEEQKEVVIDNVPVGTTRGGGFVVIPPLSEGDQVMAVFSDRDIESGLFDANTRQPVRVQANQLDYAVVVSGVSHDSEGFTSVKGKAESFRIGAENGDSVIELTDTGDINIEVVENKDITVVADTVEIGSGTLQRLVNEKLVDLFNNHTHASPAGGSTGPPGTLMSSDQLTENTEAS